MDQRLVEAARVGDINTLHKLLEKDPQILEKACSVHFADSPLHVASLSGKADFVEKIVTRKPLLATETNQQGMIPLHLASLEGHVGTVKELLKAKLEDGVNQCLVKDAEGWTPLHCASQKGKISVIEELIMACPECLKEVTAKAETVLHIAVKANQFEAVKVLADNIKRHNFHNLLKAQDEKGKTAYDLAAAKKQFQVVEVLEEDVETREEHHINVEVGVEEVEEVKGRGESEAPNKEDKKKSSNGGTTQQDSILVVATLIITLTYEALVNPPTTLFKDGSTKIDWACVSRKHGPCPAGLPFLFLLFNTLIFAQSISIVVLALLGADMLIAVTLLTLYLIISYCILLTAVSVSYLSLYFLAYALTGVILVLLPIRRKDWAKFFNWVHKCSQEWANKFHKRQRDMASTSAT